MKSKLSLPTLGACAALAAWSLTGCSDEPAETQNNTNNNPNPAWAVPGTEILIVADRLNQDVPNKAAWDAVQEKYLALLGDSADLKVPEELQPLLKAALGMTPDGKMHDLRHMTCAVTLPDSSEAFNVTGDECPEGLGVYCFVGYPEANIDEANKAIEKLIADNPWSDLKLGKDGDWDTLESTDPDDSSVFIGWRSINGGYTVSLCKSKEVADRATGNTEPPATDSALAKAFQAPADSGPWCKIVIRDVADLLNRYVTSPMERQNIMTQMPVLYKVHAVTYTFNYLSDGKVQISVEANTDSASDAEQLRDMAIAFKTLAHQTIMSEFYGTPYADQFSELVESVTCETKGNVASLTLTVSPEQAGTFLELAAATQSALANGPSGDPFEDEEPYYGNY